AGRRHEPSRGMTTFTDPDRRVIQSVQEPAGLGCAARIEWLVAHLEALQTALEDPEPRRWILVQVVSDRDDLVL
ncbi:MAG: hypothetical protein ACRDZ7_07500, partial [Acidimicrobiia bacterium]